MPDKGWKRRFADPIELADGGRINTLADAIAWLAKRIPKSRHNDPDIQRAARLVQDAAERGGILMLAEIAMRKAIPETQKAPASPVSRARRSARKYKILS